MRLPAQSVVLFFVLLASACVHRDSRPYELAPTAQIQPKDGEKDLDLMIEAIDQKISKPAKVAKGFTEEDFIPDFDNTPEAAAPDAAPTIPKIPLEINDRVKKWITYFTEKDRDRFQRFINRGARYRNLIMKILEQYDVPEDLYYLAMIESGFANHAHSVAGAVGPWQFMEGTGKGYGLAVNHWLDERRDPVWATHAAAQYLSDLFRVYQSWFLALASYNAGESRIMRAVMRHNTRDFWQLAEKKGLPRETMNYIPKFIAATIIGHHLEEFGFSEPKELDWQDTTLVNLPKGLTVNDVARVTGISSKQLKVFNPALRRGQIPYSKRQENFRVLDKDVSRLKSKANQLASLAKSRSMSIASSRSTDKAVYRVKRGDNLSTIATKHGTSVIQIMRWNRLRSSKIYRGQRLKFYSDAKTRSVTRTALQYHRVKKGESLTRISRKYGQSIASIKKLNRLRGNRINIGQRLKVQKGGSNSVAQSSKRYRVKRGDNLQKIASRFGTSVRKLKRLNSMQRSKILAGQFLTVPAY